MYDYYGNYCVCVGGPVGISMRNLDGEETTSYPVDVYNVNEELIGVANTKAEYISIWNSDPDNLAIGVLSSGMGPFGFKLKLKEGQQAPEYVIGVSQVAGDPGDPSRIYAVQYEDQYE